MGQLRYRPSGAVPMSGLAEGLRVGAVKMPSPIAQRASARLCEARIKTPALYAALGTRRSGRSDSRNRPEAERRCYQRNVVNRRIADVADRGVGRLDWAESGLRSSHMERPQSTLSGHNGPWPWTPQLGESAPRRSRSREGPECAAKPSFPREREVGFTAQASPPPLLSWILIRRPLITRTYWLGG